jgi:hypothetical protein
MIQFFGDADDAAADDDDDDDDDDAVDDGDADCDCDCDRDDADAVFDGDVSFAAMVMGGVPCTSAGGEKGALASRFECRENMQRQ